jgi:hypothetical protein
MKVGLVDPYACLRWIIEFAAAEMNRISQEDIDKAGEENRTEIDKAAALRDDGPVRLIRVTKFVLVELPYHLNPGK